MSLAIVRESGPATRKRSDGRTLIWALIRLPGPSIRPPAASYVPVIVTYQFDDTVIWPRLKHYG